MKKYIVFLLLITISGCATSGRKGYLKTNTHREQELLSLDEEYRFGHYVDATVQNEYMILEDFKYENKLKSIFNKIIKNSDRPNLNYRLRILNSNDVNVFAGPGGYVYITTGLLDIIKNKSELAGVLAHEIGHICARHSIKKFYGVERAKSVILLITAGTAAATGDPDMARTMRDLSGIVAIISIQGYSRRDELQADSLAAKYCRTVGYEPMKMIDLLKRMEKKKEKERGEEIEYTLLSSHPPIDTRKENLEKQLNLLTKEGIYEKK